MQKSFQVISPVDNSVYLERPLHSSKAISAALNSAKASQSDWRQTSINERAQYCQKAIAYLLDHAQEIGEEITWQMGRPIRYSANELLGGLKERAEYMISIADQALADVQTSEKHGFRRFITREPLGTVMVLAPWNYPFLTAVNAIIAALMAGNTVILKHALQTPLCAERFDEAFKYADLPTGVFQYLHITHEDVAKIIQSNAIDFVAFTGSVKGGIAIEKALAGNFIQAGLELGGKDPAYVRADADLKFTLENLVDGSFFNSGQSCCGIERIYVDEKLYADFVHGFVKLTKGYNLGDPSKQETNLGPLVRSDNAQHVQRQIAAAIKDGAKGLIESESFQHARLKSPYMAPQVLVNVNHDMDFMKNETFGPAVGIMSVKSDKDAIRMMNDSQYGLTASVWSQDSEKAFQIGKQIETGTFFMNRCDYLDPELAWTGVKNSGRGCTLSKIGYESMTRPKSFHLRTSTL